MAEHARAIKGKQGDSDQKRCTRQPESGPSVKKSLTWDEGKLALTRTPFVPRMAEHAAIISRTPSPEQNHAYIMRLQQTYGNRYVQRLLKSIQVQAKLTVSAPGDAYEQEADSVAEKVVRSVNRQVQRQPEEEAEVMAKRAYQVQRQPAEEEELQAKSANYIQRTTTNPIPEISSEMEDKINAARDSGEPLPEDARQPMEQAFGADFSGIRIHKDDNANTLNKSLQAEAFTRGQDIFFRRGTYNSESAEGQKLLAHELTHTIQQTGRADRIARWGKLGGGTTHIEVTNDAFKGLGKEYEFWYSPEAQKHLAETSESMDFRAGFLISSYAVGQIFGLAYKTWRTLQKGGSYPGRGLRATGRGFQRFLNWTGKKVGITKGQYEIAEKSLLKQ